MTRDEWVEKVQAEAIVPRWGRSEPVRMFAGVDAETQARIEEGKRIQEERRRKRAWLKAYRVGQMSGPSSSGRAA